MWLMLKRSACIYLYYLLWTILFSHHGVRGIWILECLVFGLFFFGDSMSFGIASHCIALHCMASGVLSRTYDCDRTGTTSFIGHNDAASYFVGYEGRSSYASICIYHHWFGITIELHTLMGMKAGEHMYWDAVLDGWILDVMELGCHMDILCFYANMHFEMAYGILDTSYACLLHSHALPLFGY